MSTSALVHPLALKLFLTTPQNPSTRKPYHTPVTHLSCERGSICGRLSFSRHPRSCQCRTPCRTSQIPGCCSALHRTLCRRWLPCCWRKTPSHTVSTHQSPPRTCTGRADTHGTQCMHSKATLPPGRVQCTLLPVPPHNCTVHRSFLPSFLPDFLPDSTDAHRVHCRLRPHRIRQSTR